MRERYHRDGDLSDRSTPELMRRMSEQASARRISAREIEHPRGAVDALRPPAPEPARQNQVVSAAPCAFIGGFVFGRVTR